MLKSVVVFLDLCQAVCGYYFPPWNGVCRRELSLFDCLVISAPEVHEFLQFAAAAAGALLKETRSTGQLQSAMAQGHLPLVRNP
jgi:hypothetical protein